MMTNQEMASEDQKQADEEISEANLSKDKSNPGVHDSIVSGDLPAS